MPSWSALELVKIGFITACLGKRQHVLVPAAEAVGVDGEGRPALPKGPGWVHDVPIVARLTEAQHRQRATQVFTHQGPIPAETRT